MASITVVGKAMTVISDFSLDDLKFVKKYRPKALVVMGGDEGKDEVFRVDVAETGYGDINDFSVCFDGATSEGKACLTVLIDAEGDVREAIADEVGAALVHLKTIEEGLHAVVNDVTMERQALLDSITVI